MEYMFLFFTHSGAIKFKRECGKLGLSCELMPVPRILSSNCTVSAKVETSMTMEDFFDEGLIDGEIEKIYIADSGSYTLVHEGDF